MGNCDVKNVPPVTAMAIFKKNGIEVSMENAKVILDLLYQLANIAVDQYRSHENG